MGCSAAGRWKGGRPIGCLRPGNTRLTLQTPADASHSASKRSSYGAFSHRIAIMSRPNKRPRTTVNCRGCGCGHPECESCGPEPEEYPDLGRPQFHQPPPYQRSAQQQSPDRPLLPRANLGPDYPGMLSQLDDRSVRQILTGLAITSPSASDAIASAYFQQEEAKIQEMRAKLAEESVRVQCFPSVRHS